MSALPPPDPNFLFKALMILLILVLFYVLVLQSTVLLINVFSFNEVISESFASYGENSQRVTSGNEVS